MIMIRIIINLKNFKKPKKGLGNIQGQVGINNDKQHTHTCTYRSLRVVLSVIAHLDKHVIMPQWVEP